MPVDTVGISTAMASERVELLQGTLDLIVLRALSTMGPQHAYGLAARLEQVADDPFPLNQGTLYPALVRLEQKGWIKGTWQRTESNREAKYYAITKAGLRALERADRALAPARPGSSTSCSSAHPEVPAVMSEPLRFFMRLRSFLPTGRAERELTREMAAHLRSSKTSSSARACRPTRRASPRAARSAASSRPRSRSGTRARSPGSTSCGRTSGTPSAR